MTRIGLDTETTPFSDTISPREVGLWGVSYYEKGLEPQYTEDQNLFFSRLFNDDHKSFHNAKFDLNVLERAGYKVNGRIDDTMIMAILDDESRFGGNGVKNLVKGLWDQTRYNYKDLVKIIAKEEGLKLKEVTPQVLRHHPIFHEYAKLDAQDTYNLYTYLEPRLRKQGLWGLYNDLELPIMHLSRRMENRGIMLNREYLGRIHEWWSVELVDIESRIYKVVGKDGWDIHNTGHLRDILYNHLSLPCLKKTKKGQKSTGYEALMLLKHRHPVVPLLFEFREVYKLLTSYTKPLLEYCHKKGDVIHPVFNQLAAGTGRASGGTDKQEDGVKKTFGDVSIQTIPVRSGRGRLLRGIFMARPGYKLIAADFDQLELRIMAHFSEDQDFIECFHRGEDPHLDTAKALGVERFIGKTVNFAIPYGATAKRVAFTADIEVAEAKSALEKFNLERPKVASFFNQVIHFAKKHGYTFTLYGRRRRFHKIDDPHDGWKYHNAARNSPIQGTAADVCKKAMLRCDEAFGDEAPELAQVHDEILFEVPENKVDRIVPQVVERMSGCANLKVPLTVGVGVGDTWLEAKG